MMKVTIPRGDRTKQSAVAAQIGGEEMQLIEAALNAVQMVATEETVPVRFANESSRMLLTLLAYCYSTGLHASEEIEWAISRVPAVQYLSAGAALKAVTLRAFRRKYRAQIESSIAWTRIFTSTRREGSGTRQGPAGERVGWPDASDWARRQVQLAIVMDTAASE